MPWPRKKPRIPADPEPASVPVVPAGPEEPAGAVRQVAHAEGDSRVYQVGHGDLTVYHQYLGPVYPGTVGSLDRSGYRAYLEVVASIAPGGGLLDRHEELAQLAAFCHGESVYAWWRAAAWAGKSALLSSFVLHPPPGVVPVSFFITARLIGQDNATAFTDALLGQLSELLGQDLPEGLSPARADGSTTGPGSAARRAPSRNPGYQPCSPAPGAGRSRGSTGSSAPSYR